MTAMALSRAADEQAFRISFGENIFKAKYSQGPNDSWPELARRRHLLLLGLASDDGPALPPFMISEFQRATASGRPDGIRVPGVPLVAPLDPL